MRINKVEIANFKSHLDTVLDFTSGGDTRNSLIVIRAENGSGKTNLLKALGWAFWSKEGITEKKNEQKKLRLSTEDLGCDVDIEISVKVHYEIKDHTGTDTQFLLVRTAQENTDSNTEETNYKDDNIIISKVESTGYKQINSDIINVHFPIELKDIFLNDGEQVGNLIADSADAGQRIDAAIKNLTGIDSAYALEKHTGKIRQELNRDYAAASNDEAVKTLTDEVENLKTELDLKANKKDELANEIDTITKKLKRDEETIDSIQGNGTLEQINSDISQKKSQLSNIERDIKNLRNSIRDVLDGESLTWLYVSEQLLPGINVFEDLSSKEIIPSATVPVLNRILESKLCICGIPLDPSNEESINRVEYINASLEKYDAQDKESKALGETWTLMKAWKNQLAQASEKSIEELFQDVREQYTEKVDEKSACSKTITDLEEKRKRIDNDKLQRLLKTAETHEKNLGDRKAQFHTISGEINEKENTYNNRNNQLKTARDQAGVNKSLALQIELVDEVKTVLNRTIEILKTDTIDALQTKIETTFLPMVGSDPDNTEGAYYRSIKIDKNTRRITVLTESGRSLDSIHDLNGATQRALAVSFIWAATQLSGQDKPKILDTPIGFMSGEFKECYVRSMSENSKQSNGAYNQCIMLLTRAEISKVETVLSENSQSIITLSSNHFPEFNAVPWPETLTTPPMRLSKVCACNKFTASCNLCARTDDAKYQITNQHEDLQNG